MAKVEELENAILSQIELLSDDSIFNDSGNAIVKEEVKKGVKNEIV